MKKIILCLSIFLIPLQKGQCQSEKYDFRQTKWGMTKEEVINAEKGNPYSIESESSAEYLNFKKVSLSNITGYANIFYKFTNKSLISVTMVIFMDYQGININCNNPLPIITKISLVQRNYISKLLNSGFIPIYRWESGSSKLFLDDKFGQNPMIDPVEIEKAYLVLTKGYKIVSGEINFWLKSDRTDVWFMFPYRVKEDSNTMFDDCESIAWMHIVNITASANSNVLRKEIKPDI